MYARRQRLANLWARGGALQCCFCQEKLDFVIPIYHGSVHEESIFDPSLLSEIPGQIKFRDNGERVAELGIRPIGVDRDLDNPVPYLAILMELGCKQRFKENGKKIKYSASDLPVDGEFRSLVEKRNTALEYLASNTDKAAVQELKKKVNDAQLAVDSYNRYSISVRGASPDVFNILREANIVQEFATLLNIVMPESDAERTKMHMRPLERLSEKSHHTDWTWEYGKAYEEWRSWALDP